MAPGGNELGIGIWFEFKREGAWGNPTGNFNCIRIRGRLGEMKWELKCEVYFEGVWWKSIWNSHLNSNSRVPGGNELGFAFEFEGLGGMHWEFKFEGAWGNELGIQTWFEFKSKGGWGKSDRNSNSNSNAPVGNELRIQIGFEFEGPWGKRAGNLNSIRIQTRGHLEKMDWEFKLHSNLRTPGGHDLGIQVRVLIRGRQGVRIQTRGCWIRGWGGT